MNNQTILVYYREQLHRNQRALSEEQLTSNKSCGDEIAFLVQVVNERIIEAQYSVQACSITIAAAEYLSRRIEGQFVADCHFEDLKKELLDEFGMSSEDRRAPCALLAVTALQKALL
ncbi:MAG: iron-sulfur cluster assembly scaffold protein [Patescibacteria group bacterium]